MKEKYELYVIRELSIMIEGNMSSDFKDFPEYKTVLEFVCESDFEEELKKSIPHYSFLGSKFTILKTYSYQ